MPGSDWRILAVRAKDSTRTAEPSAAAQQEISDRASGPADGRADSAASTSGIQEQANSVGRKSEGQQHTAAKRSGAAEQNRAPIGGLRQSNLNVKRTANLGPPGRLQLQPKPAPSAAAPPHAGASPYLLPENAWTSQQGSAQLRESSAGGSVTGVLTGPGLAATAAEGPSNAAAADGAKAAAPKQAAKAPTKVQRAPKVRPPLVPRLDTDVSTRKTFSFAHKG